MNSVEKRYAFINYRHGPDYAHAVRIRKALDALRWKSFLAPAVLAPGADWQDRISDFLRIADVFVAVLTKEWKAEWTKFEVSLYADFCKEQSKPVIVVPLEFEEVTAAEHLEPLFYSKQRVPNARELTDAEICWAIHVAVTQGDVGFRSEWNSRGLALIGSPRESNATSAQVQAAYVTLRQQLVARFNSLPLIREIAGALFGAVPANLSDDPEVAWYQIIKLASDQNLLERLRTLTGVGLKPVQRDASRKG